ncbi:hypothetical protein ACFQX6_27340 [Streptosporangium lutulentum]
MKPFRARSADGDRTRSAGNGQAGGTTGRGSPSAGAGETLSPDGLGAGEGLRPGRPEAGEGPSPDGLGDGEGSRPTGSGIGGTALAAPVRSAGASQEITLCSAYQPCRFTEVLNTSPGSGQSTFDCSWSFRRKLTLPSRSRIVDIWSSLATR